MARQPFPGVITAIEPQAKVRKHLGQRVNIHVNGKFSFALSAELVARHGLRPGVLVDADFLEELLRADGDALAYARALNFMSYRTRSADEIKARLERDEWPEPVITRTLQRLAQEGLINDADFAVRWVENRSLARQRGARALRQELRQKGVAKEMIEAALPDEEQEVENALAALQPKLRQWAKLEAREQRDKMIQFLQRRGFNYGTARAALSRLEEDIQE